MQYLTSSKDLSENERKKLIKKFQKLLNQI